MSTIVYSATTLAGDLADLTSTFVQGKLGETWAAHIVRMTRRIVIRWACRLLLRASLVLTTLSSWLLPYTFLLSPILVTSHTTILLIICILIKVVLWKPLRLRSIFFTSLFLLLELLDPILNLLPQWPLFWLTLLRLIFVFVMEDCLLLFINILAFNFLLNFRLRLFALSLLWSVRMLYFLFNFFVFFFILHLIIITILILLKPLLKTFLISLFLILQFVPNDLHFYLTFRLSYLSTFLMMLVVTWITISRTMFMFNFTTILMPMRPNTLEMSLF